ncbi:MAG TPA: hypothetical protein VGE52_11510 [Pirellulales bacterium]
MTDAFSEVIAKRAERSQVDFEIEFFESIVRRAPNYIDALRSLAELLTRKGMHERGLTIDSRLAELLPNDSIVAYNLACSLALNGRRRDALERLWLAVGLGYCDWQHLESDRDLDSLRSEPAFRKLLAHMRGRKRR